VHLLFLIVLRFPDFAFSVFLRLCSPTRNWHLLLLLLSVKGIETRTSMYKKSRRSREVYLGGSAYAGVVLTQKPARAAIASAATGNRSLPASSVSGGLPASHGSLVYTSLVSHVTGHVPTSAFSCL